MLPVSDTPGTKGPPGRHILFFALVSCLWGGLYIYVPILSPHAELLGASLATVGLIVGSYGFTQMILRIPLGVASDWCGRRKIFISFGLGAVMISGFGLGISHTPAGLLVFRGVAGLAAGSWVAFTVYYARFFEPEEASRAMGQVSAVLAVSQLLATSVGGFLYEGLGKQVPFLAGGLIGLTGLVLSLLLPEKAGQKGERASLRSYLAVGTERALLTVAGLAILEKCLTFATLFGFTPVQAAALGADGRTLSLLTFWSILPSSPASLLSGSFFARRWGERRTVFVGFLVMALMAGVIPLLPSILLLLVTQAVAGFARGLVSPLLMGLSIKHVHNGRRATAMGFFQAIYSLGMFLGPVVAGLIGDVFSLQGAFFALAGVGMAGSGLSLMLLRRPSARSGVPV